MEETLIKEKGKGDKKLRGEFRQKKTIKLLFKKIFNFNYQNIKKSYKKYKKDNSQKTILKVQQIEKLNISVS